MIILKKRTCAPAAFTSNPFTGSYHYTIGTYPLNIPYPQLFNDITTDDDADCASHATLRVNESNGLAFVALHDPYIRVETSDMSVAAQPYTITIRVELIGTEDCGNEETLIQEDFSLTVTIHSPCQVGNTLQAPSIIGLPAQGYRVEVND